jgi:hypothetical protein
MSRINLSRSVRCSTRADSTGIADAAHRAERGIEHDLADGAILAGDFALVGGHVAAAGFDADLHVQLAAGGDVGDHVIRVDDLDVMGGFDVARGHDAFATAGQGQRGFAAVVHLQHDALQVEQDIDHVFTNPVECRVLVQHAFDGNLGRSDALHGGQQDAAQGVAQGVAIAALERLHDHTGMQRRKLLDIDTAGFQKCVHVHSFEWNNTWRPADARWKTTC